MKLLIVANWKLNPKTVAEAKRLFNSIKGKIKNIRNAEVVICPPFVYLGILGALGHKKTRSGGIVFGSQNCFWEEKGAYTGEISPIMLKDLKVKYVILGHSERRNLFGETDEVINKKIKAVISANLNPIFCIGENEEERNKGKTQNVLQSQIEEELKNISKKDIQKLVIAYEPVWAIGSGKPCDIEEAQKMRLLIKKTIVRKYSLSIAEKIRIIYGGSVNSKIARNYVKEANFQGVLVGGDSLNPKEFIKIIKKINQ